jgi:hypothetical protein
MPAHISALPWAAALSRHWHDGLMLPVSKDTLLRVAVWRPIRGPYCSPFDIQNCVCIGRRSNMRANTGAAHTQAIAVKHGRA